MRAGELRHSLEVLARSNVPQNDYGETDAGWGIEAHAWGAVRPLGVVERSQAGGVMAEATHLITMRAASADVTPRKRIRFGSRIFEVVGQMDYDERNIELRVLAKETQ